MVVCPYCFAIFEFFKHGNFCTKCERHVREYDEARYLIHFIWGRAKEHDPFYSEKLRNKLARLAELLDSIPH